MALVVIQTYKQSLSSQVPIHSWVQKMHMQVKCFAQAHSATPRQPRPVPKTSYQPTIAGHTHRAMTPRMNMEYIGYF